mmetsp:Transcript_19946/g.56383  ORF Transcript_19946/g.56383 Transcript_19946/m.56383 type:complete len:124 (-) Transcript_19946:44-415(-)
MVESQASAEDYLTKHNVVAIMERLSTALLYAKPAEPLPFLLKEVKELQAKKKRSESISFFTDADLRAMFGLHDPTRTGRISAAKLQTALANLGIRSEVKVSASHVDANEFVRVVSQELAKQKL